MVENYPGKHSEMFLNDINGCQPDCRLNLWNRFELDLGSSPRWAPSSCRSFSSVIKPPLIPVSCISTNPLGLIIWFSVTQIFSLLKVFFFPSPITKCFTLKHPYSHLITIISRSPQFSSNDMQFKNIRYSHKNDYRGFLTIVSPYDSINLNMIYALKTTLWENFHLSDCMHVERFQP